MTTPSESQLGAIAGWLRRQGHGRDRLTPLAGDVSPRQYVRAEGGDGRPLIVALYPPAMRATGERFLATTELLTEARVPVPEVLDWNPRDGWMLLSDAGDRAVHDAVAGGDSALGYWRRAIGLLDRLALLDRGRVAAVNDALDPTTLRRELLQSWDLVLEPEGLVGRGSLTEDFRWALFSLCDRLGEAEPTPCHRDFMARNLLLDGGGELVVIDHQDLRLGPPLYDLASLLNDTLYVDEREEAELLDLARVGRPDREAYHRAAAQRALKIVGTFAAFAERGVDRYLRLIPRSLAAARRHLERLPESAPVMRDLRPAWGS